MTTIATIEALIALPDGSRVIPYGFENWGPRKVGVKYGTSFHFPGGVCPAKYMGLPATLVDTEDVLP